MTEPETEFLSPKVPAPELFMDAEQAVERLCALYDEAVDFLKTRFLAAMAGDLPGARVRACYPQIRLVTTSFAEIDSRLSFGHVSDPGTHVATITRPDLFDNYLRQQIALLIENHGVPVEIGVSDTPIPVHFAMSSDADILVPHQGAAGFTLRDLFDVPDLATTNDDIVNGTYDSGLGGAGPLAPFSAQRVDYSLARLSHYTATDPEHFQNFVLFTNYQFYVNEFEDFARKALADPASGYESFVATGNAEIRDPDAPLPRPAKLPQMPTYHLKRKDG